MDRDAPFELTYGKIVRELIPLKLSTTDILKTAGMPITSGARGYVNRVKRELAGEPDS